MTEEKLSKLIHEFLPYPSDGQHHALRQFAKLVAQHTLEEVAEAFDRMPFGDTSASFARYVRDMKNAKTKTD